MVTPKIVLYERHKNGQVKHSKEPMKDDYVVVISIDELEDSKMTAIHCLLYTNVKYS